MKNGSTVLSMGIPSPVILPPEDRMQICDASGFEQPQHLTQFVFYLQEGHRGPFG